VEIDLAAKLTAGAPPILVTLSARHGGELFEQVEKFGREPMLVPRAVQGFAFAGHLIGPSR
jgi:hypothetical protein